MFRRWLWRLRGVFHFSPTTLRIVTLCFCVHLMMSITARVNFGYTGESYEYILKNCFALNWPLLSRGFVWQLITYMFLHGSWMHLLLNMWGCLIIGSALEHEYGSRFFLKVYFMGGVLGALGWLAYIALLPQLSFMIPLTDWIPVKIGEWLHAGDGLHGSLAISICLGASGGVFALLGCFLAMYPAREIYVVVFLVLPLRLKGRTLLWVILATTLFDAVFIQSPLAHSAHLCGGAMGYFYGWQAVRNGKVRG